jgi:hypothetical protein
LKEEEVMAGEFSTGETHDSVNNATEKGTQGENPNKVPTDVEGVFADAMKDNMPVFDIGKDDFYNNMKVERKRLRFKSDSSAAQYHRSTQYNRPFWLRHEGYLRKVK